MGNVMPVAHARNGETRLRGELSIECFERAHGLAEPLTRLPESEHSPVILALLCLLKAGLRGG